MQYRNQPYLNLPEQTQSTLTFCDPTTKQLKAWVESLPMANIGETSRQLYHAVIEFNQLKLSDTARLELMEMIRSPIHFVCQQLNSRYLHQGVVLDEQQRKVANLAQALQTHMAIGYKITIKHLMEQPGSNKQKAPLAKAIYRALTELMPAILRSYQLYIQTPVGIWQEIHQLYQIASAYSLQDKVIDDPLESPQLTIQQIYLKTILLGACQPNQLLQRELEDVYGALSKWATFLTVDEVADDKSVLVINPEFDSAPQYRYLIKKSNLSDYLGVNVLPLVRVLHNDHKMLSADNNSKTLIVSEKFSLGLLEHLIQSWGGMKQRSFSRTPAAGEVTIAVGLTATHYHIADGVGFYSLLYGTEGHSNNPFMGAVNSRFSAADTQGEKEQQDVWNASFDAEGPTQMAPDDSIEFTADIEESHPKYSGQLVNLSPRGYCVQWTDVPASNLKTGEIVAIKEDQLQHWNLGVVRWIRQGKDIGTQMGIELLAPNSRPCGIRMLNKTGSHGDFLRALYIPEIKAIGQGASVITPRLPFNIGNKVSININGVDEKFQLSKRVMTTGIISQFQVRSANQPVIENEQSSTPEDEDGFESLWRQL